MRVTVIVALYTLSYIVSSVLMMTTVVAIAVAIAHVATQATEYIFQTQVGYIPNLIITVISTTIVLESLRRLVILIMNNKQNKISED